MVLVTCTVSKGDLPIEISWFRGDERIVNGQHGVSVSTSKRSSQLSIESVAHDNQGVYTCTVKNIAGSVNHSAELTVNGKSYLYFFLIDIV